MIIVKPIDIDFVTNEQTCFQLQSIQFNLDFPLAISSSLMSISVKSQSCLGIVVTSITASERDKFSSYFLF